MDPLRQVLWAILLHQDGGRPLPTGPKTTPAVPYRGPTPLPPGLYPEFDAWMKSAPNQGDRTYGMASSRPEYDWSGYFLAMRAGRPEAPPPDERGHTTDYFKTPYHPTFSQDSRYAGPNDPFWRGRELVDPRDGRVKFRE